MALGIIKNEHGTIRVYTRNHINGCKAQSTDDNDCLCPKWLYENRKGHKPLRYAAETPSFAEAFSKAKRVHDGWNPEIAAARAEKAKSTKNNISIVDALDKYLTFKKRRPRTIETYRSNLGWIEKETGVVHGHFLGWVEAHNVGKQEEEQLLFIRDVTAEHLDACQQWMNKRVNSETTMNLNWRLVRQFFRWAASKKYMDIDIAFHIPAPKITPGNRCGAFTDQQYRNLIEIGLTYFDQPNSVHTLHENQVIKERLHILIDVMRYTGMAIIDAIRFSPFVETSGMGLRDDDVLVYRRQKSKVLAVVPIENRALTARIREGIPLEKASDPRRPFWPKDCSIDNFIQTGAAVRTWTHRLSKVYKTAGIDEIETELGVRLPHAHMFRDTFAKWHLDRGTDIRDLSKMLGHRSVMTTERHYASWLKSDQEAMIQRIRSRIEKNNVVAMPAKRRSAAAGD